MSFYSYKSFVYDASDDSWTRLADTKYGRYGGRVVAGQKRIYALGGLGVSTGYSTFVEEYKPEKKTW